MASNNVNEKALGKTIILNAAKLEESLADLLRSEARLLRKNAGKNYNHEEVLRINRIIRYLLFSITVLDDRIKTGLELIEKASSKTND